MILVVLLCRSKTEDMETIEIDVFLLTECNSFIIYGSASPFPVEQCSMDLTLKILHFPVNFELRFFELAFYSRRTRLFCGRLSVSERLHRFQQKGDLLGNHTFRVRCCLNQSYTGIIGYFILLKLI